MDIAQLAEQRQRKIDSINASIDSAQAQLVVENEILDRLHELMAQSSYTIAEINYLLELPE
ncbi:membrane protein [Arthrobacter phage Atuin]|nr:membrane protein [Arthrobacter phage Atuin]